MSTTEVLNWQVVDQAHGTATYAKRTQAVRIGDVVPVPYGDFLIRVERYSVRRATPGDYLQRVTRAGYLRPVPATWFVIDVEGPVVDKGSDKGSEPPEA